MACIGAQTLSRSHIIQLKTQLQSIKKGAQSISEFIQRIKTIFDNLTATSCLVDDEDLIIHTLNGLPPKYGPFKISIQTRSSPISIGELHVLLPCEELNIESLSQPLSNHSSTAILTPRDTVSLRNSRGGFINRCRGRGRGKGHFNNRGRGGSNNQPQQDFQNQSSSLQSRICLQICNRSGHFALNC